MWYSISNTIEEIAFTGAGEGKFALLYENGKDRHLPDTVLMKKRMLCMLLLLLLLFAAVPAAAEENLLENGGFAQRDEGSELPAGWFYDAWDSDDASGYAIFAEDDGGTAYLWSGGNDVKLCQTVSVKAKSVYKLTCRVRTKDVEGGAGANLSVLGSLASSQGVYGTTDGFQTLELIGKTAKKQNEITVCVRIGGYGAESSGGAWFDDVSVEHLADYKGSPADFSVAEVAAEEVGTEYADGEVPYLGESIAAALLCACLFFLVYSRIVMRADTLTKAAPQREFAFASILILAFLARSILSMFVKGHSTDIACFMAWANMLAENGPAAFYNSGLFADYPPGYMYVLWLMGSIAKATGFIYGSAGHVLLIKMPAILADLLAAYAVYRIACRYTEKGENGASLPLLAAAFVAFNPVMAFVSGGWGQIDQVLSVLLLAVILLFIEKKVILAGLVYGAAIIVKPQALMAGPLLATAYFAYIADEGWKKGLLRTVAAVAAAVGAIFLLALPFKGVQENPLWFVEKLLGTATSYPFASIEAFNFFAFFGGNWADAEDTFFLFSYKTWGTVLICLSVLFSAFLYLKGRKREKHALSLSLAWLLIALFMLGHYMHERYLFPALLLLTVAFAVYRDRRLFVSFAWLSCSTLLNVLMAIIIVDHPESRGIAYDAVTRVGSALGLGGFAYLTWACSDIMLLRRKHPAFTEKQGKKELCSEKDVLPAPVDTKLHFAKKDRLYCVVLTAAYALAALLNLGTTTAPETPWYGYTGDTVEIRLGQTAEIDEIRVFGGMYEGTVTVTAPDGTEITYRQDNNHMFRWHNIGGGISTDTLTLSVTEGKVWFNEVAFFDGEGKRIEASAAEEGAFLFDEPEETPDTPSYLNGMYFDELYHARTAYEHLHGIAPYENSHPPLGKIFIMLGIAVFGMNAFGWRIVGTLFGIGMVPIMYAFAKQLFKKSEYALLGAFLFAFDFMHFSQTRIATIDVYGVFFILLMFYCMHRYFMMNFYSDGLKKTLKPLALAGIFFGLGAASKWICFYAGAGLAVIYFTSLVQRYIEYRRLRNSEDAALREKIKPFWKNAVLSCLWCCLFYVLIPAGIYLLSYLPYVLSEASYDLAGIWGVQQFMFGYHSGLEATHPYQSSWWQWPFILRPIWYHVSYYVDAGNVSTISAMGNPAVWWVCSVTTLAVIFSLVRGTRRGDKTLFVLLVGLGANFLPWVLISRCTFIYHFFASVPFILLITVYALSKKEEEDESYGKIKWIWMAAALLLFVLFYPAISGFEVPRGYISFLEWLPGWTFMGT